MLGTISARKEMRTTLCQGVSLCGLDWVGRKKVHNTRIEGLWNRETANKTKTVHQLRKCGSDLIYMEHAGKRIGTSGGKTKGFKKERLLNEKKGRCGKQETGSESDGKEKISR